MEYKRFKMLAQLLLQQEERCEQIMEKPQEDLSAYMDEPDEYLSLELKQFVAAFDLFLRKKKKTEEIRKHHLRTEKQRITAETKMAEIRDFFQRNPLREAGFYELVKQEGGSYDVVLTFSSLLEMMKEKRLEAEQKYLYGDITVRATRHLMEGGNEPWKSK